MIRKAYQHILAQIYDPFLASLEEVLTAHRKELLSQTHGQVLEVGAGTGVNFKFYPPHAEVFAVEPSPAMYKKALKKKNASNIHLFNMAVEEVPASPHLPDRFDFIVSMLVMCSVKDERKVADLYKQLLKPGGKLLVLEHIHSGNHTFYGKFQTIVNPVWRPLSDGCNLTRRQDLVLKEAGFVPLKEEYFRTGTDWYKAIMMAGNKVKNN